MTDKNKQQDKSNLDNNKEIEKMLRECKNRAEIAEEISTNSKISNIVGERLASKKRFPPC